MTNKQMPEVGKRYRRNSTETIVEIKKIIMPTGPAVILDDNYTGFKRWDVKDFLENFEELPDNSQQTNQSQVKENVLSDEVKGAMSALKKHIESYKGWDAWLYNYTMNLLHALEAMEKSNIPEKGDCGITNYPTDLIEKGIINYDGEAINYPKIAKRGEFWYLKTSDTQDKNEMDLIVCSNNTENGSKKDFVIIEPMLRKGDCGIVEDAKSETGIFDRNGHEIHVGDFVRWGIHEGVVRPCEGGFVFAEDLGLINMMTPKIEIIVDPYKARWSGKKQEEAEKEGEEDCPSEQAAEEWNTTEIREEQPQSIWKDVSELPKSFYENIFIRFGNNRNRRVIFGQWNRDGFFNGDGKLIKDKNEIESYVTLTDFINDIEALKERVKKLEDK